nr:helix-turn-helix transcriptional regulator [Rarobacter faecitabidus]
MNADDSRRGPDQFGPDGGVRFSDEQLGVPIFVISRAAELAGMHPQTLRQYDRLGLVSPRRTAGKGRRYSLRDVATLREIQRLSKDEGINLAGIRRILALESEVARLRGHIDLLLTREPGSRIFEAGAQGDVTVLRSEQQKRTRRVTIRGVIEAHPHREARRRD